MKKIASLLFALLVLTLSWPQTAVRAYTPTGVLPITIVAQPFNISGPSVVRFVFTAPPEALADTRNIVDVQLHRRVATRDSLQSIATGDASVRVIDTVSSSLRNVARDAEGRLVLNTTVSMQSEANSSLTFAFDGVYPVTLSIRNSQTNEVIASVLTFVNKRQDVVSSPASITTLIRLTATPSLSPEGLVVVSEDTRQKVRDFVAFLATYSAPLTIGIEPEVLSALALSTQSEDAQLLTNLREQLRRFSVVTSTFTTTDVSLFAATGLDDEFIEQLRLGESTLNRYLPDVTIQRSSWIADAPITASGTQLLRKAGIASLLLMPNAQRNASTAGSPSVMTRPEGRPTDYMSILKVDPNIASVLSSTSSKTSATLSAYRSAAEAALLADDLRAAGQSSDEVRIVVSSQTGEVGANNALTLAARAIVGANGLSVVDMSGPYLVTTQTPITTFSANAPTNAQDRARQISAVRRDLDATASMIGETDVRRDLWAHLLAVGESSRVSSAQQYLDGLSALLLATRQAVTINTPGTITLSGRNSIIRLQVRNNSATELIIRLQLTSAKLELDSPDRLVTLNPESTTEIEVPAEALSNGRFPISMTVTTPSGNVDVVPRTTITARVNALAGYGQLVSISLLLVLGAWWWSHWRKGKLAAARATTVSS
ncbi:unannotated protein [freshwater metagenome]|uniref:Unannotated protein n=1 Tax=freshwater metagenome TaxID=449393 RepID=A0A6J6DZ92_9ZZZZ|nr:hypothetical protein [Actinomycetota bacterium]